MTHYLFVDTNPVPGKEDEFNDWYTNTHLADVVAIPQFIAAQRFARVRAVGSSAGHTPTAGVHQYRAVYEIDGDPDTAVQALMNAIGRLEISDAMERTANQLTLYRALTHRILPT